MQPLTEKQTQRVWSRVMSAQTAPAAAMENPAPAAQAQSETLTPEKLLSLIDGERADSALYAHLAARMKGRAQAMLHAIAQQEACHAKKARSRLFSEHRKKSLPRQAGAPLRHLHQRNAPPAVHRGARRARGLRRARRECRDAPVHAAAHGAGGMRARAADPLHPAELPVKNFFLLSATFPLPGLFTGQNGK